MSDAYIVAGLADDLIFLAINMIGKESYIEAYITYTDTTVLFPVLQDTEEAGVWAAFGAVKDDMMLIDLRAGLPGLIVESWMGAGKIAPATSDDQALLMAAIDGYLGQAP